MMSVIAAAAASTIFTVTLPLNLFEPALVFRANFEEHQG
jgi:hypothetical protein